LFCKIALHNYLPGFAGTPSFIKKETRGALPRFGRGGITAAPTVTGAVVFVCSQKKPYFFSAGIEFGAVLGQTKHHWLHGFVVIRIQFLYAPAKPDFFITKPGST